MPTYRVTLTKSVTDGLIISVEVKARNPNHAAEKAIDLDAAGKLSWEFNVADPEGGSPPEIESVEVVRPFKAAAMTAALLVALVASQPASACEAFGECTARAVMQEQQDRAQQARMDHLTQDNQRLQTEARDTELRSVLGIDPWSSPRR